jgi:hypothetical protein
VARPPKLATLFDPARHRHYNPIVALPLFSPSLLDGLRRDAVHAEDVAKALVALRKSLDAEGIPFAVIGALAMRQHGYVRFTEDIDIVTTPEGLTRIHERLVGRGLVPRAPGLRKKLRDTVHQVNVDVIQTGEHAGAPESPVIYPDPHSAEFGSEEDGVRYANLDALIAFKIASGVWGKRPRDLADAQELIKVNGLDEGFAIQLPPEIRDRFVDLVAAARLERDIE